MQWIEVNVAVTHEAVEAVADMLTSIGSKGVAIEDPQLINDLRNSGTWELCDIPEQENTEVVTVSAYYADDEKLEKRLAEIDEQLALIEERSPMVVEEYQNKLQERLTNLLADNNIAVEPERLLQEVAIFADRTSITEEIVRLKSHIKQFKHIIASDQPVGRKLDFLIQEFNREANTIASKANDYTLAQIVVEIKAEIEKIREQIQNIE